MLTISRRSRAAILLGAAALLACAPRPTAAQQPGIDSLYPATPTGFVTDVAHVLSDSAETQLSARIRGTQHTLGGDIGIVTLPTIGDFQPYEVGNAIIRRWGIGGQGAIGSEQRNLGALILVVPKVGAQRGRCFISTAQGAEGIITDAMAGDMCREAVPFFKTGDYEAGVNLLVGRVIQKYDAHIHPPPPPPPYDWSWLGRLGWLLAGLASLGGLVWLVGEPARRKERAEEAARQKRLRDKLAEERKRQETIRADRERQLAAQRQAAREREAARWAALTPEQQAAEIAAKEEAARVATAAAALAERRRQEQYERERPAREAAEAAARKKRDEDDEEDRRRRSSYSSSSDYGSSSSSSSDWGSSSSSDSFGGGGGSSGGGGGSDW